jgi:hypothetical protein
MVDLPHVNNPLDREALPNKSHIVGLYVLDEIYFASLTA